MQTSSAAPFGLIVKDYASITANTIYMLNWKTPDSCDTTKWASATACNGITKPWAFGTKTDYNAVGPVKGSIRAWHYLGDVGSDINKVWSIEAKNVLNVLLYEYVDKKKLTALNNALWGSSGSYAWYVQ